ncbi:MAG: hypothetical protein A2474_05955 [Elusimicrobia bacterium RIFOXYC2_FULL_34_12]|nr:MAG: hypothetical protein A2474_05955 [Elusimicrobia bacterium RIFOXYC2_FULL_34_12]HAM38975.1 hypothetical protein [Elusimicrobiota bacterium]
MNYDLILLVIMMLAALMTVLSTRLLIAAIGLALTSVMITILMFKLKSPLAGVFELSICAGLITVIFISTISFVKPLTDKEIDERTKQRIKKYLALPILLILIGIILIFIIKPTTLQIPLAIQETNVRKILWDLRQVDLLGQVIILLVGVFGIVVLFRDVQKETNKK